MPAEQTADLVIPSFLSPAFSQEFLTPRLIIGIVGRIYVFGCRVLGVGGLISLHKEADGDVTVREGPRRQQQNRCTEQQTASSFCGNKKKKKDSFDFGCELSDVHTRTHSPAHS